MVVKHIQRKLQEKSEKHTEVLRNLGLIAAKVELPPNVYVMPSTPQFVGMNTILQTPKTEKDDFVFYFDRLASILIEKYVPICFIPVPFSNVNLYHLGPSICPLML